MNYMLTFINYIRHPNRFVIHNMKFRVLILLLLVFSSEASAINVRFLRGPYKLYIGPEVYYLKRFKEGGSRQKGALVGGRFQFERESNNSIYFGAEGYIARGKLRGRANSGSSLSSTMTDSEAEGKLGWKFHRNWRVPVSLTPFLGYGYFRSKNALRAPSPIFVKYTNKFEYTIMGLYLEAEWACNLSAGIDFKAKYMVEGTSKTSNDPFAPSSELVMSNRTQYEVALPIKKTLICQRRCFIVTFSPFYRYRHYGGRENFPYNFYETKFDIYGANLMLMGSF